jgi:type II secretory pathway pseudopilin PulG
MERTVERVMMLICTAPMPTDKKSHKRLLVCSAFTLAEIMVAVLMISLFTILVHANLSGVLRKSTFRGQMQDFISTMRKAVTAATESDRRYEVVIDLVEQSYLLREITTVELSEILEEEIITEEYFSENCYVAYVEFDDGDFTNDSRAKFRAGRAGWQYGGVIVFLDKEERAYSVVVNRTNRFVKLQDGEVRYWSPRSKDEMPF